MDTTQDLTQTEQTSFEDFEKEKSESILAAFFDDCNEEEQKIINEFSQIQGIRANDAVWVFVKVFFGINRANNALPQRISDTLNAKTNEILEAVKQFAASSVENEAQKAMSNLSDSLMKISQDFLNQQRKRAWIYDFFVPVACACMGIFFLCLISFIGGAAVAGKGWGHSPVEALLNAPAGWIIPLALIPVGGFALFRGITEQGKGRLINLMTALIMAILFLCVLIHIL
ncbi:MAG: hypothetical protein IJ859_01920 [Synergistaceae bacterium]|nr:hypothetical protein [Synergistaceae bacterium]